MATLKTNTLTGTSTAGSIAITGEGNSTTTNLQQGLAKVWCDLNGTGTIATRDSFNEASLTDNGTGSYNVNFTNNMGSANYSTTAGVNYDSSGSTGSSVNPDRGNSTTALTFIEVRDAAQTADRDREHILVTVHGDLA
tara:strand:+ start:264 stop:677 length:414 start_codon:yes stop_codon:yes gene_type:complete